MLHNTNTLNGAESCWLQGRMAPNHSSHEFVRALKSASDPPVPDGPLKVEIASHAWKDASFYVPRKAEVIVDWILGKLLKDRLKAPCVFIIILSVQFCHDSYFTGLPTQFWTIVFGSSCILSFRRISFFCHSTGALQRHGLLLCCIAFRFHQFL